MYQFQKLDKIATKKGGWVHVCYCASLGCIVRIFTPGTVEEVPAKVERIRVFGFDNGALSCVLG